MKKSVLLTRSESANFWLKEQLKKMGFETLECSLIDYELQEFSISELENYTDIIITSFFAASNVPVAPFAGMNAWVVGIKSAVELEKKGYKIQFVTADAQTLKKQIPEAIHDSVVYISGNYITVNMPINITRKILYKVTYREFLLQEQKVRYKQGIDYILLYSENCAKTLIKLLAENDLVNYLENATILAISSKVESVVESYFSKRAICYGTDSMLKYLESL